MKPTVIIGFANALSAPEVVWSLVDEGYRVIAFARRGKLTALHHSRNVVCHEITPPEVDVQRALSDLHTLLRSIEVNNVEELRVLFPLDDGSIWLCNNVPLGPGWVLAGPRDSCVELALKKRRQIETAHLAGFNVPETIEVEVLEDISSKDLVFPLFIKPAIAAFVCSNRLIRARSWVCESRKELDSRKSKYENRGQLLIQPLISGIGEGIFGIATSEGVACWSAHKRLRMMNPQGSGSSACTSQPVPEDLKLPTECFIRESGWRGLFMIELLRDRSGKAWFMELNGRPWGSMALARRQGLEYPAWGVQLAISPHFHVHKEIPHHTQIVARNLGRELMHLLFVLRGPKSKALTNWPSFWKSILDVALIGGNDFFYNWRRNDPKVFIGDCCYTVRDQVFKSRR